MKNSTACASLTPEGNKARKEQLKPTILQAEEQLHALLEQPGELEKKARNAEINYLKNKR